jgi:hypothetical protein
MKKWMLLVALVTCVLVFSSTQQAKAQFACGGYYSGYAPGYPYYSTYYPSYAYSPVVSYGYGYPQYSYGYYPSYGYSYYRPSVSVFIGSGYRGYGYGGWGHHHRRW